MNTQTYYEIRQAMLGYMTKGKKSDYKKKQMKRLFSILNDILENEPITKLSSIGKKQIIGYWRRTESQTEKTRKEKYQILKKFMLAYNPKVTVPLPKPV